MATLSSYLSSLTSRLNAKYYREKVLGGALKPWARKHIGRKRWTFQQDLIPSHRSRENQEWLKQRVKVHFVHTMPSNSPDANPMEFSIWSILESKVRTKNYLL